MVIVRATRKLLQRLGPPLPDDQVSAGLLGDWYATYLPWRPRQVGLLVNERTLLPLLMPLASAATFLNRFPDELSALLEAHHIPASVVAVEVAATRNARLATTANRSLLGSMNEFAFLAEGHRAKSAGTDLLELSLTLARTVQPPLQPTRQPRPRSRRTAGRANVLTRPRPGPGRPLRVQPDAITNSWPTGIQRAPRWRTGRAT